MFTINLGDRVKDPVSGFNGIAVQATEYLNGCRRIGVQPEKVDTKTGKPFEYQYFDEPQLRVIKKNVIKNGMKITGGDRPEPINK